MSFRSLVFEVLEVILVGDEGAPLAFSSKRKPVFPGQFLGYLPCLFFSVEQGRGMPFLGYKYVVAKLMENSGANAYRIACSSDQQ